ncbi:MAG: carbohydrate ABC transporter permease [Bacillota bacterium]|nr:carbohydrate ABC transporter permease [Bacillota bacterium]
MTALRSEATPGAAALPAPVRAAPRRPLGARLARAATYAALVAISAGFLVPLAWLVLSSLKPGDEIFIFPPRWFPSVFRWSNYAQAVTSIPFLRFTLNTLLIAGVGVVGNVLSSSVVAYGFARYRFPGRDALFVLMLATTMIPFQVLMVPQYILFKQLGWLNSFLPLTVPAFFGSAFYVFMLRQFILTLPPELDDAARIDGANAWQIFWHIVLPNLRPALTAVGIFAFQGAWNDFLAPLIYLDDHNLYTLQLGLNLFRGSFRTEWNLLMAASVLTILPVLLLFFFAQRHFIEGVKFTGGKG